MNMFVWLYLGLGTAFVLGNAISDPDRGDWIHAVVYLLLVLVWPAYLMVIIGWRLGRSL